MAKLEGSAKLSKKEGDTSINVSLGRKGLGERIRESREAYNRKVTETCVNCGKFIDKPTAVCSRNKGMGGITHHCRTKGQSVLCEDCAKKCKICGKYFCPEHLENHKCIHKKKEKVNKPKKANKSEKEEGGMFDDWMGK